MCVQKIRRAFIILFISSLFLTCGELDTVLPSSGTYKVNALVNNSSLNESSLNESSLITKNDRIFPYFVTSVTGDPDVQGLLIFLQTPAGEIAEKKIHYTLKPVEEEKGEKKSITINGEIETKAPVFDGQNAEITEMPQTTGPVKTENKETETLIHVNRLDKDLPPFSLPENLPVGQYTLVFQILGEKEILDRTEKHIYYLDDVPFSLNDIQRYLPDISDGSYLIPPGTTVMLEAKIISGERLDPYVVWYSGKKRISEGRVSGGADLILWKVPEQTGFHTVRAEAFPYLPVAGIYGKSLEISLPVSAKAAGTGYFSGESEHITHWYQFRGNLQDSKMPVATERALIPKGEKVSQWSPQNNIYGLTIGPRDIYLLPGFSFVPSEKQPGVGRFMFRFKPVAEGTVFSAFFKSEFPPDSVYMDLVLSKETLQLNLSGFEISEVIPADFVPEEAEGFISLFIDYALDGNRLGVTLGRENTTPPEPVVFVLSSPLNGEGSFQFGASLKSAETGNTDSADGSVPPEEPEPAPVTAILDEFAAAWLENAVLFAEPADVEEPEPVPGEEPESVSEKEPGPILGEEPEPDNSKEQLPAEPADVS
jgi:hypothetical protein